MARIVLASHHFSRDMLSFQADTPLVRAIYPALRVCVALRVCAPRNSHYGELWKTSRDVFLWICFGSRTLMKSWQMLLLKCKRHRRRSHEALRIDVKSRKVLGMLHTWWVFEERRFVFGKILIYINIYIYIFFEIIWNLQYGISVRKLMKYCMDIRWAWKALFYY